MKLFLIAVMLAVLSGCGAYSHGSDSTGDRQSQTPATGNGGGGNGGGY